MKTLISYIDEQNIDLEELKKHAKLLKEGKTVIFPTETVYGIGADALNEDAVSKIYKAKGRPSDNPLIVHISNIDKVYELSRNVSDKAKIVMEKFWPGPLTIILPKNKIVPNKTTGGLDTVAVRMPSNKIALKLLELSDLVVAAPSANISGRPSPTKGEHVVNEMNEKVSGIIVGDKSDFGIESTVIDFTEEIPLILRPGVISQSDLEKVIGKVNIDKSLLKKEDNIKAKAPGMKYTHYSPNADVFIFSGENKFENINKIIKENEAKNIKSGVICKTQNKDKYLGEVIALGKDSLEIASNLFDSLRQMDNKNIDVVYAEEFEFDEVGVAVMNRLLKASGYKIIKF